ncbi:MAG: DUF2461 domain-containing protein [Prevotellaceae bacterium]|jgi:uncharacterized protein (TIGR02453 family)|nr:DUF2461 domain-containing protein [Prevotellaceae bacterium]
MTIDSKVFTFLSELEINNNREWFAQNKQRFEDVKQNVLEFVGNLIAKINAFDPSIGDLPANKTLFRIYRDTRFSSNKEPYKTNLGAVIVPVGYRSIWSYPAYYLHLKNNECFVSMGVYMPDSASLKKIRSAIDSDFEQFEAIMRRIEPDFGAMSREEGALQRVPAGFSKDSPAAEYLKLKHFYVFKPFSNRDVTKKDFLDKIAALFAQTYELKCWLIEANN